MMNSLLLATAVLAAGAGVASDSTYVKQIQDWRTERVEHLRAPHGWLSLVGLDWLKDGKNTLGSAKGNDIVLAKAPAHLGTITLDHGKATIALDAKSAATIDGKSAATAELLDDS